MGAIDNSRANSGLAQSQIIGLTTIRRMSTLRRVDEVGTPLNAEQWSSAAVLDKFAAPAT